MFSLEKSDGGIMIGRRTDNGFEPLAFVKRKNFENDQFFENKVNSRMDELKEEYA